MTNWKYIRPVAVALALFMTTAALSACEEEGAAEKAGKQADEAMKDMKKSLDNATK